MLLTSSQQQVAVELCHEESIIIRRAPTSIKSAAVMSVRITHRPDVCTITIIVGNQKCCRTSIKFFVSECVGNSCNITQHRIVNSLLVLYYFTLLRKKPCIIGFERSRCASDETVWSNRRGQTRKKNRLHQHYRFASLQHNSMIQIKAQHYTIVAPCS